MMKQFLPYGVSLPPPRNPLSLPLLWQGFGVQLGLALDLQPSFLCLPGPGITGSPYYTLVYIVLNMFFHSAKVAQSFSMAVSLKI